jgi:hypothetical protein
MTSTLTSCNFAAPFAAPSATGTYCLFLKPSNKIYLEPDNKGMTGILEYDRPTKNELIFLHKVWLKSNARKAAISMLFDLHVCIVPQMKRFCTIKLTI